MPEETTPQPAPLSVKQVAKRLNVAERTVWRLVEAGQFPAPRYIGSHPRWFAEDVDHYLWEIRTGRKGLEKLPDEPKSRSRKGPDSVQEGPKL